ncbi:hypothetical protein JCM19233_444 [Vibrio astriarenae]|nr:hypothetical protein JCM19233_444 [Vibrio sp. C7]
MQWLKHLSVEFLSSFVSPCLNAVSDLVPDYYCWLLDWG